MKANAIRLPDVEAAMLVEFQRVNKRYRDLRKILVELMHVEYGKSLT